jgi:small subunit ribosomal protein S16
MRFMLKIRLQRTGRKHEPTFRVVLTESTNSTKSGRYQEILGSHDPRRPDATVLKEDRIKHWIAQGAQTSGTLHNMLISKGVIAGKKINVLPLKRPIKKEGADAPVEAKAAPAAEAAPAPAPEVAPEETAPEAPVADEPAPAEETPAA